jgi:hypothetical protein
MSALPHHQNQMHFSAVITTAMENVSLSMRVLTREDHVATSFVGGILHGIVVRVRRMPHVSYVTIALERVIMLGMKYSFIGQHPGDAAIVVT